MPRPTENQRRLAAGLPPIRDENHGRFSLDIEDLIVEHMPPEQFAATLRRFAPNAPVNDAVQPEQIPR